MIRSALVAAAAVFSALAFAGPASAESFDQAPSVQVRYGDLNLRTTAGAERMYGRIEMAAEQVCRVHEDGRRDFQSRRDARACRAHALEAAVAQLSAPLVTAQFERHHTTRRTLAALD